MPVFQSLEAYWPGLQVRAVIPVACGDFVHLVLCRSLILKLQLQPSSVLV